MQIRPLIHPATGRQRPESYLGSPGRPSWSADGRSVALKLNGEAVVIDRDTQEVTARLGSDARDVGAPQFSPDGSKIAYDVYRNQDRAWSIEVSDSDGLHSTTIAPRGRRPQWSPDGRKIAFSTPTDDFQTKISLMNHDGSEQQEVSSRPHSRDFSWSPDGSRLAYEAVTHEGYQLRTVDLDSGTEHILSDGQSGAYWDRTPTWSPTGKTIAFERRHKRYPAASLWTIGSEGGPEKLLLQKLADVVDPVYSPDGTRLIFGSNHGGRAGLDLFEMDLSDLSLKQLTDTPGDEHSPAFSPDGNTLAYLNTDRRRADAERHRLEFLST